MAAKLRGLGHRRRWQKLVRFEAFVRWLTDGQPYHTPAGTQFWLAVDREGRCVVRLSERRISGSKHPVRELDLWRRAGQWKARRDPFVVRWCTRGGREVTARDQARIERLLRAALGGKGISAISS